MRRSLTDSSTKKLALVALIAAPLLFASGCVIAVDDELVDGIEIEVDGSLLTSMQVDWTIDHTDSASMCAVYGIDRWQVTLTGPETRETVIDCRDNYWSTENDLLYLPRGDYRITVTAVDGYDLIVGSVSTSVGLYGAGLERVSINFDGAML